MNAAYAGNLGIVAQVEEVSQYGVSVLKPANPLADMVCRLAGTRTMTRASVDTLKAYGFTVEVLPKAGRTL